jgi:hypothetical protein
MEIIFLTIVMTALLVVFGVDARNKRRNYLIEHGAE